MSRIKVSKRSTAERSTERSADSGSGEPNGLALPFRIVGRVDLLALALDHERAVSRAMRAIEAQRMVAAIGAAHGRAMARAGALGARGMAALAHFPQTRRGEKRSAR